MTKHIDNTLFHFLRQQERREKHKQFKETLAIVPPLPKYEPTMTAEEQEKLKVDRFYKRQIERIYGKPDNTPVRDWANYHLNTLDEFGDW